MATVTLRVEHTLGRKEALARVRKAAEGMPAKAASYVKSVAWSDTGAVVEGTGFTGRLVVGETDVVAEVDLGWQLSFFPLKVRHDGESFLRDLLK